MREFVKVLMFAIAIIIISTLIFFYFNALDEKDCEIKCVGLPDGDWVFDENGNFICDCKKEKCEIKCELNEVIK